MGLIAGWGGATLAAQDDGVPTLHVYANLMQIPVLVLSPFGTPMPPIAAKKFFVSIDSGPRFRATHVRPEGDDPISLSIFLDVSGSEEALMPKIDEAIAGLAPLSLRPRDHVSIYALDCSLTQSLNDAPAEAATLKRAVDLALESWTYRRKNRHVPRCSQNMHLWDALTLAAVDLSRLPGRRVILAITDGIDKGSKRTWNELRIVSQATGVAIFGVTYLPYSFGLVQRTGYEDAFNSVCELSGGMRITADDWGMTQTLQRFTKTVRDRYIVEFPRPLNSTAGKHSFVVTIEKSTAVIRPAGISVPIADPALLADPTTVPSDPSQAPVEGTRKTVMKPH